MRADPGPLWSPRGAPLVVLGAVAAAAAATILGTLVAEWAGGRIGPLGLGEDFYNLWSAAGAGPGGRIYAQTLAEFASHPADPIRAAPFSYPPFAALAVRPLSLLSFPAADLLWLAASVLLLAATCWMLARPLLGTGAARLLAGVLVVATPFVWWCLQQGQPNIPLLAMLIGAALLLSRDHDLAAGVLVGLAGAIKGYPILGAVYFAWAGRWRALAAAAAAFAVATGAGFLLAGSDSGLYLTAILPAQLSASPAYDNSGLPGVFRRFLAPNVYGSQIADLPWLASLAPKALSGLLVGATLLFERGGRGRSPFFTSLALVALLPLIATTSWRTTFLFSAPALWLGAGALLEPRAPGAAKAAAVAALLLMVVSLMALLQAYPTAAATAQAIRVHDALFYLWGLGLTAGGLAAWLTILLLAPWEARIGARAPGGGPRVAAGPAVAAPSP